MKTLFYAVAVFFVTSSFSQNAIPKVHFITSESGLFGLADTDGNLLVDTIYDENIYASLNLEKGEAIFKKNNEWQIINYKNELVLNLSSYSSFSTIFSWEMLSVTNSKTGKSGYINREGEVVILFNFEMTYSFEKELPLAIASVKGKWGVINLKGEWVLNPKYGHVYEIVSENEFIVLIGKAYYGINIDGKVLYEEEMGC